MGSIVKVRNIELGEGVPKIAVPFVGCDEEEIMEEVAGVKTTKLDIVEWRIDYYRYVEDVEKVKKLLQKMRKNLNNIPILVTFRTVKEGGKKEISLEYYIELNRAIASTGNADMIDIELFIAEDKAVKKVVEELHEYNIKVIMSNHDFHKTPHKDELVSRMCRMQQLGADIAKIAVMPCSTKDVLELLSATCEMKCKHNDTPIITMSMGTLGVITRLAGETFGSALTFGSAKAASAPGQLEANELYKVLHLISEYR
ncbi:type I 3-dehydroquinate dehydratase [Clostridium kluyveri]|uniref:type I 3-dehydroquinate dehydratase n=1 Tax=Clostridium kluyveri TaxID=1534 RepID=UPI0022462B63|nr:type I 3-dehydroquinate dehydratase [Clostridium kluyveri]UZQ50673.1 type I 3-dehydroquinate dehydratase [Clostridium kluyveri]